MQISHVVLNYFFISYIIVVFLFILHIDSCSFTCVLFKDLDFVKKKKFRESWSIQTILVFLEKSGCKVSFNFLYFPHKAEFMSGSQEILMFNDWKCSTGMKFKFLFDIFALSFHLKEVWVFKLVLLSLHCQ